MRNGGKGGKFYETGWIVQREREREEQGETQKKGRRGEEWSEGKERSGKVSIGNRY